MFVSAFELYRIGLGPSSAHTTGPMRAARRFVHALEADGVFYQTRRISCGLVRFSRVHGPRPRHRSGDLSGLCGDAPDAVDPRTLAARSTRVRSRGPAAAQRHRADCLRSGGRHRLPRRQGIRAITATRCASLRGMRAARPSPRVCISRRVTARSSPTARCRARARRSASRIRSRPRRSSSPAARATARRSRTWRAPTSSRCAVPVKCARACCISRRRCATPSSAGLATDDMLPGRPGRPRRAATQAAAISGTDPSLPGVGRRLRDGRRGGERVGRPRRLGAVERFCRARCRGPAPMAVRQPLDGDDGSVTFLLAAAAVGQLLARRRREACGLPGRGRCRERDGGRWTGGGRTARAIGRCCTRRSARSSRSSACLRPAGWPRAGSVHRPQRGRGRARGRALRGWRCDSPIRPVAARRRGPRDGREGPRDGEPVQGKLARRPRGQRRRVLSGAAMAACYPRRDAVRRA